MFHLCVFGGHEVDLSTGARVFITFCGGCEGRWPTIARQLVETRGKGQMSLTPRRMFFITVMGGTELKLPTLADEFAALQDAMRAGVLTQREVNEGLSHVGAGGTLRVSSFTIMGGLEAGMVPSEDEELDRLAMHRQLGAINEAATQILMSGAGQKGVHRETLIRRALEASFVTAPG